MEVGTHLRVEGSLPEGFAVPNESVLFFAFNTFTGHLLGTWPCAKGGIWG